jgi:hypothetical protein
VRKRGGSFRSDIETVRIKTCRREWVLKYFQWDISHKDISNREEGARPDVASGGGLRLLARKNLRLDNPDKPAGIVDEVGCVFPV